MAIAKVETVQGTLLLSSLEGGTPEDGLVHLVQRRRVRVVVVCARSLGLPPTTPKEYDDEITTSTSNPRPSGAGAMSRVSLRAYRRCWQSNVESDRVRIIHLPPYPEDGFYSGPLAKKGDCSALASYLELLTATIVPSENQFMRYVQEAVVQQSGNEGLGSEWATGDRDRIPPEDMSLPLATPPVAIPVYYLHVPLEDNGTQRLPLPLLEVSNAVISHLFELVRPIPAVFFAKVMKDDSLSPVSASSSSSGAEQCSPLLLNGTCDHGIGSDSSNCAGTSSDRGGILVHCLKGASRSVSLVAAFVMKNGATTSQRRVLLKAAKARKEKKEEAEEAPGAKYLVAADETATEAQEEEGGFDHQTQPAVPILPPRHMMRFLEVMSLLKLRRAEADPNAWFRMQLMKYERFLFEPTVPAVVSSSSVTSVSDSCSPPNPPSAVDADGEEGVALRVDTT